jgi:hypothetical protein
MLTAHALAPDLVGLVDFTLLDRADAADRCARRELALAPPWSLTAEQVDALRALLGARVVGAPAP